MSSMLAYELFSPPFMLWCAYIFGMSSGELNLSHEFRTYIYRTHTPIIIVSVHKAPSSTPKREYQQHKNTTTIITSTTNQITITEKKVQKHTFFLSLFLSLPIWLRIFCAHSIHTTEIATWCQSHYIIIIIVKKWMQGNRWSVCLMQCWDKKEN